MSDIIPFPPGGKPKDPEDLSPTDLLKEALEAPFTGLLIIGMEESGRSWMRASNLDSAEIIRLCEHAKLALLQAEQEDGNV